MTESTNQKIVFDPYEWNKDIRVKLQEIDSKLEMMLKKEKQIVVEWITFKKFMEVTEIKGRNTLSNKLDRMKHKRLNGRIFIHKDEIKKYYDGEYND